MAILEAIYGELGLDEATTAEEAQAALAEASEEQIFAALKAAIVSSADVAQKARAARKKKSGNRRATRR